MSTDNTEKRNIVRNGSRWLRVGLLTFSMAGPVINTIMNQARKRTEALREQAGTWPDSARNIQAVTLQRLDDVSLTSRKRAAEQAKQLRKQAQQLQTQATQLRKALRDEAKQRQRIQKLQKQWQKSGNALSQEWLKRGEVLTGDIVAQTQGLVERSSKASQQLTERGSKATQELVKRGSQVTQDFLERGGKLSQDVIERGGKVSQELLERGGEVTQDWLKRGNETTQELLERGGKLSQNVVERGGKLVRERNSRFWTIVGFTTGLVAAGVVTYVVVRRRFARAIEEFDEQIELPQNGHLNGNGTQSASRPTGEVRHINSEATAIVIASGTKTEHTGSVQNATQLAREENANSIEAPADAAFVGVVSTKLYYPAGTQLDANDLIYFNSADEAQADGFNAAPTA